MADVSALWSPDALDSDVKLRRMLGEQLECARTIALTPMVLLRVDVVGRPFELGLGVNAEMMAAMGEWWQANAPSMISEVTSHSDAAMHWEQCGIGAWMSTPVAVDTRFVGVLCVLDTSAREFTDSQQKSLGEIAYTIGKRFECFLGPEREERRESLMNRALSPTLAELRNALVPINVGTSDMRLIAAEIQPAINNISGLGDDAHAVAVRAFDDFLSLIDEISRASDRVRDVVMVVETIWGEGGRGVMLNELLATSVGLALHSTRLVGGVTLPEVPGGCLVRARRSVAVAGLGLLLSRAAELDSGNGAELAPLTVSLDLEPDYVYLRVAGKNLLADEYGQIVEETRMLLMGDRDVWIDTNGIDILLRLPRLS